MEIKAVDNSSRYPNEEFSHWDVVIQLNQREIKYLDVKPRARFYINVDPKAKTAVVRKLQDGEKGGIVLKKDGTIKSYTPAVRSRVKRPNIEIIRIIRYGWGLVAFLK